MLPRRHLLAVSLFVLPLAPACDPERPDPGSTECQAATEQHAVVLAGDGLVEHDGHTVFAVLETAFAFSDVTCRDVRSVAVAGGSFSLTLQNGTDGQAYPTAALYVDVDGDEACGADEPRWSQVTSVPPGNEITIAFGPGVLTSSPAGGPEPCELFAGTNP